MSEEKAMQDVDTMIIERWERVREYLEPKLEDTTRSIEDLGIESIPYYLAKGGKMFRGFLTILFAESLGGTIEKASDAAVAIEIVHAASLAMDDIIDRDVKRRGKLSSWVIYGVGKTALTSLLLIPVAQRIIQNYGFEAIKYSIKAWESMVRGEILDAYAYLKLKPSDYIEIIKLKTASLFSLSTVLGAIAAKNKVVINNAETYGNKLGIAYQIADDISDYYSYLKGEKEKLDPGEILFEKWVTANNHDENEGDIIRKGIKTLSAIVDHTSSVVNCFPNNVERSMLSRIPHFMVSKMLESVGLKF
ncbi:MAG: polyprenyl synthetase family protein [Caldisphaeraceae archaeon]|nr:polyprenyl synthetase family protein [Caldisphaeraceae archaeon]MEB2793706.1 polyprenyl synthetase family protein [Caldisphaeraceae archaeon]MEB3692005.1 polyprenyl synthetase family protein [Caldisphaeraceae archaeon]MEB3798595.1 polyprenyl synthetase family protein [Caldisphaeraceae archaeon]